MATKASEREMRWPGVFMRRGRALLSSTTLAATTIASSAASANDLGLRLSILTREDGTPIILSMTTPVSLLLAGMVILTATTAILHIIGRQKWAKRLNAKEAEINELQARVQSADTFNSGERHIVVAWGNSSGEPDIEGDASLVVGAGAPRRILGFTQWLPAPDAQRLEANVEKLKLRGEAFSMSVDGSEGKRLEIDGRAVTGRAVMRIREVSGDRLERIKAEESYGRLAGEMAALHSVLDALPQPVWLRYHDGRLAWVNKAYAEAVECRHPNEVISKKAELIDSQDRERISRSNDGKPFHGRINAILAGKRTQLEVFDARTPFGSGGIGHDVSEIESLRSQLEAEMATHVRTLNELPIAVAIFDRKQNLRFNNAAYQKLWRLDPALLASGPGDSEILDRLRADHLLPEQADFKKWKQGILEGYQKAETSEDIWSLPDGRILRVVTSPTPDGGLHYVYDDMTERMTLEAQFKALTRVQSETLDNLKEAVAVFGSDGRLKLANAAFSTIWRLPPESLLNEPHIDEVIRRCPLAEQDRIWSSLREAITSLTESRESITLKEARADHLVIECATAPLPDGATLVTFADVTADENNSLFLKERNDALEIAARVKNDFIKNVSFGLREPLNNVTMAVGMLNEETTGQLNAKQSEYAQDARRSADSLRSLMDDIFDLASLDAGTLDLVYEPVNPAELFAAVAALHEDRLTKANISISTDVPADTGVFAADPQRLRQILFHLVSNAIGFSSSGQTITLSAHREADAMIIRVSDNGRGIPEEAMGRIFERFERHTGSNHPGGVGLGLPMVQAFVTLHKGDVSLDSKVGMGTVVTCRFPLAAANPGQQDTSHDPDFADCAAHQFDNTSKTNKVA